MSGRTPEPIDLREAVSDETPMTYYELALIGAALLNTVVTVDRLGWESPASSPPRRAEPRDADRG